MNKRDEARKNQEWAEELFQAGEISWPEIEDIKKMKFWNWKIKLKL